MTYTIERLGVTYEVSPYEDEGQLFAVIHSVYGLATFGKDQLAELFSERVHLDLAIELEQILLEEEMEVRATQGEYGWPEYQENIECP